MKPHFVLLLLCLLFTPITKAQNLLTKAGGPANDEALDIETDASGNSYITGYVGSIADFGNFSSTHLGSQDIFVAKINSSGDFLWVKSFGGTNVERGLDLALDNNGNLYLTGYFFGNANFGTTVLSSNGGSRDLFLAKINASNGNVVWALNEGGVDAETGHSVTCDNQGNVIVCGQFEGSLSVGANTYTTTINAGTGTLAQGIILIKYNSSGNLLWSKSGISSANNNALAIHHDASDNLYITGNFSEDLTIDGTLISNQQLNAGYIAKFQANGSMSWFRKIAANSLSPVDLKISSSNIYLTGNFQNNLIYYGANSTDTVYTSFQNNFYLLKVNSNGSFTWGESLGSNNALEVKSLGLNSLGDAFVTGTFECNFEEIRLNKGSALWTSIGKKDIFAVKYSGSGSRSWERHQGGLDDDISHGISLQGNNDPIICGQFKAPFYVAQSSTPNFPSYISSSDELSLNGCGVNAGLTSGLGLDILIFEPYENASQPEFNYYEDNSGACTDSIPSFIIPDTDTIEICNGLILNHQNNFMDMGPPTSVVWNNLYQDDSIAVSSTGTYTFLETRNDECGASHDTIYVNILPSPPTLWLTDNQGVNNQNPVYDSIVLCDPDSAFVQLDDVPPGLDFSMEMGGQLISDTNSAMLTETGNYNMILENEEGCISSATLVFQLDTIQYDSLVPYLALLDNIDFNDSMSFCLGNTFQILVLDSITNPTGLFTYYDGGYMEVSWNGSPFEAINNSADFKHTFYRDTSGWVNVDVSVVIGYDNACGVYLDTLNVVDSFYIEVLPTPDAEINLSVGSEICPGGEGVITADTSIMSFAWSGPGIVNTSSDNTEITIDQPGGYVFQGTLTHPTSGCTKDYFLSSFINYKSPPTVTPSINPAYLCPGDSVQLTVSTGLTYNWIGPNGNSVGNTQSIYVQNNGEYFCVVLDQDSCELSSESIFVNEYTTPHLNIIGNPSLCEGDSIQLNVNYYGDPNFLWQPTGDTTASIYVDEGGWYICSIELCNITTTDSIEVFDISIDPSLNIGDTLFCPGDSIYIETQPGFSSYVWTPQGPSTNSFYITSPGDYAVTMSNNTGCTESTDTVSVGLFLGNELMDFQDTTLCKEDSAAFEYTGNGGIEWYIENSLVSIQDTFVINPLIDPFTMVYIIDRPYCGLYTDSFDVSVSNLSPNLNFLMDDEYCYNDSITLEVSESADNYSWNTPNNDLYTANPSTIFPIDESMSGYFVLSASDDFCSTVDSLYINIFAPQQIVLNQDSIFICKLENSIVYDSVNTALNELNWYFENNLYTSDDTLWIDDFTEDGYYNAGGIDFNNCPYIKDSTYVYNTNNYDFIIQLDTAACLNENLSLFLPNLPNSDFQWTLPNGSTNNFANQNLNPLDSADAGWYYVDILINGYCDFSDSMELIVNTPFIFNLGNDSLICEKLFNGLFAPDGLNNWSWEDGSSTQPYFVYNEVNNIYLTNEDENGCFYTDTMVLILDECKPVVPNVITPNGDGANDYFIIKNADKHPNNKLQIINRWGNPIFEEDHYKNTFQGKGLSDGTYFFIYYEDTSNKLEKPYTGFLQIISAD